MSDELNPVPTSTRMPEELEPQFWTGEAGCVAFLGYPGLFLACLTLTHLYAFDGSGDGTIWIGWALTLGVPFGLGFLTGCVAPSSRWVVITALAVLWSSVFFALLFTMHIAGAFCLFVYATGGLPTGIFGAWIAFSLRRYLRRRERARAGAMLLAFLLPYGLHAAEQTLGPARERETRRHECMLRAPLERAWSQSLLAERDERPDAGWFLVNAPRAREASGRASQVGDEKLIRYSKGHLRVRVEHVEEGRELLLRVLEQHELESKALRLHSIRITARALDKETTAVALAYEFTPLMTPRWYWRPLEHFYGGLAVEHLFELWQEALDAAPAAESELSSERR
ncbi:MAG: hypothetical protein IPN34_26375 [Planctomycetes bacterium]|nr:hypothetical protein [Planctomycetota bacterium]